MLMNMITPIKDGKFWKCIYCEAEYPEEDMAQKCVASHFLILVPIGKEDLNRLIQFLFTGEEDLLTPSLVGTLQKYSYASITK